MSQTGKKNLVITSIALYFTYFIHGIGASIMGQYKPELAAHWGAKALSDGTMDVSMVVSVIAALGLGRLISLPFSGPLSDKFGRRLSGIIGVICYAAYFMGIAFAPSMGVAGAALATVIGQFIAAGLALFFNLKVNHDIKFDWKNMLPTKFVLFHIYKVAVPSILMVSIGSVMMFCMNRILEVFTTTAIAVFGVYFKLQSFIFMPIFGMNNGMVPIIAYNYGARHRDRIIGTIKLAVMYAVAMMLIGFAVFQIIPDKLLLMFNASDNMLAIGVPALRLISISFLLAGFNIICSSVFQAMGNGVFSLIVSVIRQLVVLVPVAFLISKMGVLDRIWWSFPIAEVVAAAICVFFLRKILKMLNF